MIEGRTFSEKWNVAALLFVAGAGIVATIMFAVIVAIVWRGPWTNAVEALRVDVLAQGALAMATLMGMSMVGLLIAGPLSKISGKIGENEVSVEGD